MQESTRPTNTGDSGPTSFAQISSESNDSNHANDFFFIYSPNPNSPRTLSLFLSTTMLYTSTINDKPYFPLDENMSFCDLTAVTGDSLDEEDATRGFEKLNIFGSDQAKRLWLMPFAPPLLYPEYLDAGSVSEGLLESTKGVTQRTMG